MCEVCEALSHMHGMGEGCKVMLEPVEGCWMLGVCEEYVGGGFGHAAVNVLYCPWCGRRLQEEGQP